MPGSSRHLLFRTLLIFAVAATAALGVACAAGTRVQSSWSNPTVTPTPLRHILAIAITKDPGRRQMMEEAMASEIVEEAPGVEAMPSRSILSDTEIADEARVRDHLAQTKFDGAIVMRITDVERRDVFVPGRTAVVPVYYRTFWGYYRYWAPISYEPAYVEQTKTVQVETQVYAMPRGELVYSAISRTLNPSSAADLAERVASVVTKELRERGFVASTATAGR